MNALLVVAGIIAAVALAIIAAPYVTFSASLSHPAVLGAALALSTAYAVLGGQE